MIADVAPPDAFRQRLVALRELQSSRPSEDFHSVMRIVGEVLFYSGAVHRIFARYLHANENFFASMQKLETSLEDKQAGGLMSPEQLRLQDAHSSSSDILRQEIETFYLFSRVLLDKLTQGFVAFVGKGRHSQTSFSKFVEKVHPYISAKGLPPLPDRQSELMRQLEADIVDFRDHQIVHAKSPRGMLPIGFSEKRRETYLIYTRLFPTETDVDVQGQFPSDLLKALDEYADVWLTYLEEQTS